VHGRQGAQAGISGYPAIPAKRGVSLRLTWQQGCQMPIEVVVRGTIELPTFRFSGRAKCLDSG
jgi:hypothetical protein